MAVYELSEALLNTRPEIRIGDKLYRVDDRKKTVEQLSKLTEGEDTEKGRQRDRRYESPVPRLYGADHAGRRGCYRRGPGTGQGPISKSTQRLIPITIPNMTPC